MSVNLSDAELAEASKCRRTVSVCTPSKRCKAGTLRLLPLNQRLAFFGAELSLFSRDWLPRSYGEVNLSNVRFLVVDEDSDACDVSSSV